MNTDEMYDSLRRLRPVVKDNPSFLEGALRKMEAAEQIRRKVERQERRSRMALVATLCLGLIASAVVVTLPSQARGALYLSMAFLALVLGLTVSRNRRLGGVFILSATIFLVIGCRGAKDEYSSFFCSPRNNRVDLSIESIALERLCPDIPQTSFVGFSALYGDKLFFADRMLTNLCQFDKEGRFEGAVIRQGNGPGELPGRFEAYCVSDEGHHFFLDSNTNLYEIDQDFNSVNKVFYFWSKKITDGQTCELTDSYCTSWGDNINFAVNKGIMYTNVSGESEDFNITIPEYYKTARIIEPRDARTGEPYPLLGRVSPAVKYMTAFQGDFFTILDNGDFLVAYEADDLMYVYDQSFKVKYSFGQAGAKMDKDYVTLSTDENFSDLLLRELETKGRYTSLCRIGDLTFRTYLTGLPARETRLQIYRGTTLVGDAPVPDGFKVMGYIEPYYYSAFILDENEETFEIYRFRL